MIAKYEGLNVIYQEELKILSAANLLVKPAPIIQNDRQWAELISYLSTLKNGNLKYL